MRSRRDTRGHAITTVRDREAPGSNPGPPDQFRIQNRRFESLSRVTATPPCHIFPESYRNPGVRL